MIKRKWVYIQPPQQYEMSCDICGGANIDWSEFEHMIWCYDCEKDTPGDGGLFDGPIPVNVCRILGISFDRFYLAGGYFERMKIGDSRIYWEIDWKHLRHMWE